MPIKLTFALLLLSAPAFPRDILHKVIFGEHVTACIASGFDGATTVAAINAGAHETNPFLVKRGSGGLSIPMLIGGKTLFCGLPILATWAAHKYHGETPFTDAISISGAAGSAGYFTWAGIHNLDVINQLHHK